MGNVRRPGATQLESQIFGENIGVFGRYSATRYIQNEMKTEECGDVGRERARIIDSGGTTFVLENGCLIRGGVCTTT